MSVFTEILRVSLKIATFYLMIFYLCCYCCCCV